MAKNTLPVKNLELIVSLFLTDVKVYHFFSNISYCTVEVSMQIFFHVELQGIFFSSALVRLKEVHCTHLDTSSSVIGWETCCSESVNKGPIQCFAKQFRLHIHLKSCFFLNNTVLG